MSLPVQLFSYPKKQIANIIIFQLSLIKRRVITRPNRNIIERQLLKIHMTSSKTSTTILTLV